MEFTKEEKDLARQVSIYNQTIGQLYDYIVFKDPELKRLHRCANKAGQYKYFQTWYAGKFAVIIKRLKIRRFLDLGSGAGLLLLALRDNFPEVAFEGVEIESKLAEFSKTFGLKVYTEDITLLTSKFLHKFDCLYFWTPFSDPKLQNRFQTELIDKMKKGQYLLSHSSSFTALQREKLEAIDGDFGNIHQKK